MKYLWHERDYFSLIGFAVLAVLHTWMAVLLAALLLSC
jgi:hypothetical protein